MVTPIKLPDVLRSAWDWGAALAAQHIAAGETSPRDGILSGEWAGDLTPADVYRRLLAGDGFAYDFVDADTREKFDADIVLTEILDDFEAGYLSADWPDHPKETE